MRARVVSGLLIAFDGARLHVVCNDVCDAGYWGAPVVRTCDRTNGVWSGSDIICSSCVAPVAPSGITASYWNSGQFRYSCAPGTYGMPTIRSCNTTTGGWYGNFPSCAPCGVGYYCPGGDTRTACPAGRFGSAVNLATSSCSGLCQAGYYCPQASTTARQSPCGGADRYCPTGSAAPLLVPAGNYSTPLDVPDNVRTGYATCLADRNCTDGAIQAGVSLGDSCPGGTLTTIVSDSTYPDACQTRAALRDRFVHACMLSPGHTIARGRSMFRLGWCLFYAGDT
ncbi:MAG: hypothetical protein EOO65_02760, partial [Methanosarcinales archaeon]